MPLYKREGGNLKAASYWLQGAGAGVRKRRPKNPSILTKEYVHRNKPDMLSLTGFQLTASLRQETSKEWIAVVCIPKNKTALLNILRKINPLNAELNPICYLLALLAHHFLHVSRIRVKSLTLRLLMSCIYIWSTYS